ATFWYSSVQTFLVLMDANTFSASLGWSQKLGPMVISCSFCSASSLVSMSKMPPQGSYSIPQVLDLFFSHGGKYSVNVQIELL
ncbi:MAG TPA: hypothetical protein VG367_21425, partial [Mucilaginibacter sp.]|nr:hypothetical protein [Mucilaginibacter sp.]